MTTHPPLHHTGLCASAATDTRQYVHYSDVEGVVREIKIVDDKVVNLGKDKFSGAKYFSPLATFHWLSGSELTQTVFNLDSHNSIHERRYFGGSFHDNDLKLTAAEYSDLAAGYVIEGADRKYRLYLYFQDPNGDILEYSRLHSEVSWVQTNKIKDGLRGTSLSFAYRKTPPTPLPALIYQNKENLLAFWRRSGTVGTPITGVKPTPGSALAAVHTMSDDRVYYVDAKNEINEHQYRDGLRVQRGLGAFVLPGGKLDAVAFGQGDVRIFFQNTNGALCRKIYSGGKWADELVSQNSL